MLKYILKKLVAAVITIFLLATLTFFLMKAIPGDPFQSDKIPIQVQQMQRSYYGLDKPVMEQYAIYMKNLLHGDLGTSLVKKGKTISSIIGETFPISATLGMVSFVFAEAIGILFGILCARYRGKFPDYVLMIVAIGGIAMPSMIIGPLSRYVFGAQLRWLPPTGWGGISHIIMPAFVLGLSTIASETRNMRASMLGVLTKDYIKTAEAKGLSPKSVVIRHEIRNAMIPIVTNMGVKIADILIGSFVVESIFVIPGLGRYFVNSVTSMDYPLIMGVTIFYGSILVVMNMLVDIVYGFIDPRIRTR